MKFLIVILSCFFFLVQGAAVITTPVFYALPRTFSVFLSSMPASYNDQVMVSTLSKAGFNSDFDQRCTAFLLSFFGDTKTMWQFAQERTRLDNEYQDRFMWAAIIALKIAVASGLLYFLYPWPGWDRFASDLKEAYVTDHLAQCFSIPITTLGLFAVYRVIASTLAIKRYSTMVTAKVKSWLTNNVESVPQELASWYKIVASYDEKTLEHEINSGAFATSLWSALCKKTLSADFILGK